MSFLGSVARLGGQLVRPHDIVLERDLAAAQPPGRANRTGRPASSRPTVERVVRLGFEVRVELRADTGERFAAQVTRAEADRHQYVAGETVHARATHPADATDADPALAI